MPLLRLASNTRHTRVASPVNFTHPSTKCTAHGELAAAAAVATSPASTSDGSCRNPRFLIASTV
uniref:Uncharacterized protein n=1 Tax=Oryza meridionalis TaxID=40149 RepID=A0A0E0ERT6_9ORYZ